jgi:preprotein translocase subunit SecA
VNAASAEVLESQLDSLGNFMLHRLRFFESVEAMGGLHIIGTERHESRRIDNQLRGRSGRQGDQGSSRFFLALDDDLMKMFAGNTTLSILSKLGMKEGDAIEAPMLTRAVEKAQRKVEERNFQVRKQILEYDEPMEYQRRTFYGMRQPLLEHEGIRATVVEYIEDAVYDAAHRYLGPEYVATCISEWVREKYNVHIDPERFKGKDRDRIFKVIDSETVEEATTTIQNTVGEYMPEDTDPAEWSAEDLQNWAQTNFGASVPTELVKSGDRHQVRRVIELAAEERYRAIDNSPVEALLVPNYGASELAQWATTKFGAPVERSLFAETSNPDEAAALLLTRAMEIFHDRELRYPIEFVMELTSGRLQAAQQDPEGGPAAANQALSEFCAWAASRYGVDWSPEALPTQNPAELAAKLLKVARTINEAELNRRAQDCLAGGTDVDSIAAWFERTRKLHLTDLERTKCQANPEKWVHARVRSLQRQELEQFERWVLLQIYDEAWKDNLHQMDQLRDSIGFRSFSQKDPRIEFKKGAAEQFNETLASIRDRSTELLFKGRMMPQSRPPQTKGVSGTETGLLTAEDPAPSAEQQSVIDQADRAGSGTAPEPKKQLSARAAKTVGRNEPCPCGSGKKYKACHGANA